MTTEQLLRDQLAAPPTTFPEVRTSRPPSSTAAVGVGSAAARSRSPGWRWWPRRRRSPRGHRGRRPDGRPGRAGRRRRRARASPTDYVPGTDIDTRMADVIAEHLPSLPAPDDVYPSDSHRPGPLPDADFARAEDWRATYTLDGSELLVIASAPSEGGVACAGCAKQQVPAAPSPPDLHLRRSGPLVLRVSFERPDGSAVSVYESLDAPDEQTGQDAGD